MFLLFVANDASKIYVRRMIPDFIPFSTEATWFYNLSYFHCVLLQARVICHEWFVFSRTQLLAIHKEAILKTSYIGSRVPVSHLVFAPLEADTSLVCCPV